MDLGALAFPGLTKTRERLLAVLSRLTLPRALKYLDISAGLAEEAERNLTLLEAPAAPAHEVYTGVLYEHLGLGSLPGENVLIASALWGFVRPSDRIPAYRLSMGSTLPRIPSLPALWRDPLRKAVPDEGLIVDLRSGAYAAAWKPKQADGRRRPRVHRRQDRQPHGQGHARRRRPHPALVRRRARVAARRRGARPRCRTVGRAQRFRTRLDA